MPTIPQQSQQDQTAMTYHMSAKRRSTRPYMISTTTLMRLTIILMCLTRPICAHVMEFDTQVHASAFFEQLAARGEIHVDQREPPQRQDIYLERRQVGDSVVPTTVPEATSTSSLTSSSTSSSSLEPTVTSLGGTPPAIMTAANTAGSTPGVATSTAPSVTVITTPLPTPFDTSLGSNFTSTSCPSFFSSFLTNSTFHSCVPISLLLQNSNSFFRAQRSFTLLTQTLDAACNARLALCSPLMTNLASQLVANENCGQDYRQQNPLVMQAYAGLTAYEPVYRVTCLRDKTTNAYCFTKASTNSTNAADFYPYYTAVGLSMPQTASPTCSQCLRDTMQIFAGYAENAVQPVSKTYMSCATQVDKNCGSQFVSTDVKVGSVAKPSVAARGVLPCSSFCFMVAMMVLILFGLC